MGVCREFEVFGSTLYCTAHRLRLCAHFCPSQYACPLMLVGALKMTSLKKEVECPRGHSHATKLLPRRQSGNLSYLIRLDENFSFPSGDQFFFLQVITSWIRNEQASIADQIMQGRSTSTQLRCEMMSTYISSARDELAVLAYCVEQNADRQTTAIGRRDARRNGANRNNLGISYYGWRSAL